MGVAVLPEVVGKAESYNGCVTHAERVTSEGHVTFVGHIIPKACVTTLG